MQSPDWSHVANPSRCQFCQSEYHLSCDKLYPEPASSLFALTPLPQPGFRGHDDVTLGSLARTYGPMDSIRWWNDSAAEKIATKRRMLDVGGSELAASFEEETSSGSSLELSDLEPSSSAASDYLRRTASSRWSENSVEEWHVDDTVVEPVRRECTDDRAGKFHAGDDDRQRRSCSSSGGREWVVRRRSDGSRYIRRRSVEPTQRRRPSVHENINHNRRASVTTAGSNYTIGW